MKKQFYLPYLVMGINITFSVLIYSMEEKQESKFFNGIVNRTTKKVQILIGNPANPLFHEIVNPNTAKIANIELKPNTKFHVTEVGYGLNPVKPTHQNFVIIVDEKVHPRLVDPIIKYEEVVVE